MPAAKCHASGAQSQPQTRRFNGIDQTSRQWNSLHKDRDLWDIDANCVVHLHAKGSSQRPPSLRIPFTAIQQSKSKFLLENCLSIRKLSNASIPSDSGYEESSTLSSPQPDMYDLFIPAPANLTKEQAYTYHVTTRNFFAFLTKQALVGEKLGLAMTNLCQRMKEWLPEEDATVKILNYCDEQGYLSLANNITHAAAILTFAEGAEIRDLWMNAFVHCVGMYDRLDLSRDYPELSSTTKALITRASLELDLHMSRATRAIGCFLEEELGADRLGLSKPARNHLDRFRGFLHSHYLEQVGYFPPDSGDPYNKKLWNDIHDDFQSLYELLADTTSDMSIQNNSNASGGICCLQNTQAFDSRHGCTPLPHPCPLLPSMELPKRTTETQRTLRSLRLGRSSSTLSETKLLPRRALAEATNSIPDETSNRPIIAAYRHFERVRLEEKITLQEARKIRWLLIYGALQILNSITRAPKGVRDIEAASYPLCVLTNGLPEWHNGNTGESSPGPGLPNVEDLLDLELTTPLPLTPDEESRPESEGRISIHPDCEADNAADYFSNSRRSSINALDITPPPLRITRPTRTTSIRMSVSSGVDVLQRSFSMARRNSSRKMAQAPKPGRTNSYEVVGQGYGDVTQKRVMLRDPAGDTVVVPVTGSIGTKHNLWQEFDFGLPDVGEEPILNDRHLDSIVGLDTMCGPHQLVTNFETAANTASPQEADESTSGKRNSWVVDESAFSASWRAFDSEPASATTSGSEPNSLRSSYLADRCDTPSTMYSPSQSPRSSYPGSVDFEKSHASQQSQQVTGQRHISLIATRDPKPCLNAGCYRPSGLPSQSSFVPALSKFASSQTIGTAASTPDIGSAASSIYHMDRQQADERGSAIEGGGRWKKISDGLAEFTFDR